MSRSARDGGQKWIDNFGIQILIYVMLGWGLNIVVGLAGLLDLGYVAFYAVGAYSYALLGQNLRAVVLAAACRSPASSSSFWGILLGFPVLRLRGDYLAIVTLAFGEIIRLILINWTDADQRLRRHQRHSAADLLRHSRSMPMTTASPRCSALNSRRSTASSFFTI